MIFVKEQTEDHCVIRTDTYVHSLEHILNLFNTARQDFPDLKPKDVKVVQYGGRRYARTFGIEFEKPREIEVPEEYDHIQQLEYTG